MGLGFTQGCHRCGGHPGHKTKDRAYLIECQECGTYTCNQHITVLGGCPKCKSSKTRKVMTQRDVKKHKKGGLAEATGDGSKSKNSNQGGAGTGSGIDENQETGNFARGGKELPKGKNQDGMSARRGPAEGPEEIRDSSRVMEGILPASEEEGGVSNKGISANVPEIEKSDSFSDTTHHTSHRHEKEFVREKEITREKRGDEVLKSRKYESLDDLFDEPSHGKSSAAEKKGTPDKATDESTGNSLEPSHAQENRKAADKASDKDTDDEAHLREDKAESDADHVQDDEKADEQEKVQNEENLEDEKDDSEEKSVKKDELTDEEKLAIEEEFKAIAAKKENRIKNLPDIEFMRTLAKTKRENINVDNNMADAFWGLSKVGAGAVDEALAYVKSAQNLKKNAKKDRDNPHLMMSVLAYQPSKKIEGNLEVLDKLKSFDDTFFTVGYGPKQVAQIKAEDAGTNLKNLYNKAQKFIGIGVIGLDKHYAAYTIEEQKTLFKAQLDVAVVGSLPVYLSCREAAREMHECLNEKDAYKNLRYVMTDLIRSDEMLAAVQSFDMHVCLRPELTYESNKQLLANTLKVNPARWLLCSGYGFGSPKGQETRWNKPEYLVQGSAQISDLLQRPADSLRTLCMGNMARLFFGKPWRTEREQKEDIWADFE